MDSLTLDVKSTKLTDEQFFELCSANRDVRFERSAEGELIIMAPKCMDNGVRLGWLIDPKSRRVEIYRLGQEVEVLESLMSLSGEDVLPGFRLDLSSLWA